MRRLVLGGLMASALPSKAVERPPIAFGALPRPLPPLPASEARRFDVSIGDYHQGARVAEVVYRLEHGPDRYRIETMAQATGLVALVYSGQLTQTSEGALGATGLMPERYVEKRGRRPERSIRFDRGRGLMIGGGEPAEVPLPTGTQDRLSLGYQLGLIARGDPRMVTAGQQLTLPLASMKVIESATITCTGETSLRVKGESLRSVKYEIRNPRHADDRIDIWLGPDQAMLPVRIRFVEGEGKIIDQVLSLARP